MYLASDDAGWKGLRIGWVGKPQELDRGRLEDATQVKWSSGRDGGSLRRGASRILSEGTEVPVDNGQLEGGFSSDLDNALHPLLCVSSELRQQN